MIVGHGLTPAAAAEPAASATTTSAAASAADAGCIDVCVAIFVVLPSAVVVIDCAEFTVRPAAYPIKLVLLLLLQDVACFFGSAVGDEPDSSFPGCPVCGEESVEVGNVGFDSSGHGPPYICASTVLLARAERSMSGSVGTARPSDRRSSLTRISAWACGAVVEAGVVVLVPVVVGVVVVSVVAVGAAVGVVAASLWRGRLLGSWISREQFRQRRRILRR